MYVNTIDYRMMDERGESALYWRFKFSKGWCTAKERIQHQVWY